jgi:hypothetical protein
VAALAALGHDIGRARGKAFVSGCLLAAAKPGAFWFGLCSGRSRTCATIKGNARNRAATPACREAPIPRRPRLTDFPRAPGARRRQSAALLSRFAA